MRLIRTARIWFLASILLTLQTAMQGQADIPQSQNFELVKISDGVYAAIHKVGGKAICNAGIVNLGDKTLIFDTFLSPKVAAEIPEVVEQLGFPPVGMVVNSHFHNDHIRGNQVFPEGVPIYSTSRTKELIETEEPLQLAYEKEHAPARLALYDSLVSVFDGVQGDSAWQHLMMWQPYYEILVQENSSIKTRVPNMFVDDQLELKGADRTAVLLTIGGGHTDSDLVLYLPDDRVVFTGDLLFINCHPYLGHGDPDKLRIWLTHLQGLDAVIFVPGHGPLGTKKDLSMIAAYVGAVESHAQRLVDAGRPVDDAEITAISAPFAHWWFKRFYEYNLRFMHGRLSE